MPLLPNSGCSPALYNQIHFCGKFPAHVAREKFIDCITRVLRLLGQTAVSAYQHKNVHNISHEGKRFNFRSK